MVFEELPDDPKTWMTAVIQDFCEGPENTLQNNANERAWEDALIGFSRGDDSLYRWYKEYVGPYHWTPWEIFTETFFAE